MQISAAAGRQPGRAEAQARADPRRSSMRSRSAPSEPPAAMSARARAGLDTSARRLRRGAGRALLHWSAETDAAIEQRVAAILADVRTRGDAAVLDYTAPLRRHRRRVGRRARDRAGRAARRARRRCRRRSATRSKPPPRGCAAFHERQLEAGGRSWSYRDADGTPARPEGDAARPRRHLRAGRQGGLSVERADERAAGQGGGRRRDRDGGADAAAASAIRWCSPRPRVAGVDRVFTIGGAQAIGALAYGTATVPAVAQDHRPRQRLRRQRQAARLRHGRHRHDRRAERDPGAGRRHDAARLGGDGPVQPGRARRAGAEHPAVPGRRPTSTAVQAAIERLLPAMPRRDVIRASLEGRGALIRTRSMEEACEISNRIAPEHLEVERARARSAGSRCCAMPARSSSAPSPARASATTAPARTTCCRPRAPRASRRRSASTTSRSAAA